MPTETFYCETTTDSDVVSNYISDNYPDMEGGIVVMRVGKTNCIVCIDKQDVPDGLDSDSNITVIDKDSNSTITTALISLLVDDLGITESKIDTDDKASKVMKEILKRADLDFDDDTIDDILKDDRRLWIDLVESEMDL